MTHLLLNLLFLTLFCHFLLPLNASIAESIAEFGFYLLDDQLHYYQPLTRENLSIHSQKSEDSLTLSSSLKTTDWLPPIKEPQRVEDAPTVTNTAESGTTSSECESAPNSPFSLSPKNNSAKLVEVPADALSKALKHSTVITTLCSFLTAQDRAALKATCKRNQAAIEHLPAHQLASVLPCLAALFLPDSKLNAQLVGLFAEIDPLLLEKFKKFAVSLRKVSSFAHSENESESMVASFDNLQALLWFFESDSRSFADSVQFFPLFQFFKENIHELAYNLTNPDGPFISFAPEIFPVGHFFDVESKSEAALHSELVSIIRSDPSRALKNLKILIEAIGDIRGPSTLLRIVYFSTGKRGWTLLHAAAINDAHEIIKFLLCDLPRSVHLQAELLAFAPRRPQSSFSLDAWLFPALTAQERKTEALHWLQSSQLTHQNRTLSTRPTPLMSAIRTGNLSAASTLYRLQNQLLSEPRLELMRRPLLHLAVLSKSASMLKTVLYELLPTNGLTERALKAFTLDGMNPLQLALSLDWNEAFELILEAGAQQLNWSPTDQLHFAHPSTHRLPIHIAAQFCSLSLVKRVLALSSISALTAQDARGNTPLVYALRARRFETAHLLWSRHPDSHGILQLVLQDELEPIKQFFSTNQPVLLNEFLTHAPFLHQNVSFASALILARNQDALEWFFSAASPSVVEAVLKRMDVAGNSLLHLAVLCGNLEAFEWLLGRGALMVDTYCNGQGKSVHDLIEGLPSPMRHKFERLLSQE